MKNNHSNPSVPAICRSRHNSNYIRKAIVAGLLALIFGPLALMALLMVIMERPQNMEYTGWLGLSALALVGGGGTVGLAVSIYRWVDIRRGILAKSVLKQCDCPEKTDLFAVFQEIDQDIFSKNLHIGPLDIGNRWILGPEAMRIDRIRGVFSWKSESGMGTKRQIQLNLGTIDCDWNSMIVMLSLDDQRAAYQYLTGTIPNAYCGGKNEFYDFLGYEEGKRKEFNSKFLADRRAPLGQPAPAVEFNYLGKDAIPTSRFDFGTISSELESMTAGQQIVLTATNPFPFLPMGDSLSLNCARADGYVVTALFRQSGTMVAYRQVMELSAALRIFRGYYMERKLPVMTDWESFLVQTPDQREPEKYTLYVDRDKYQNITFEDIQATMDGLDRGIYQSFYLMLPSGSSGYLSISLWKKINYVVETVLPLDNGDRYLKTLTTDRKMVLDWLYHYFHSNQRPDTSGWLDITKDVERDRAKNKS